MNDEVLVCGLEDIPNRGSIGFWPDNRGRHLALAVRNGNSVHAYVNLCPHYGQSRLGWKKNEFLDGRRNYIICAAHGALFRLDDGVCILGPCLGRTLKRIGIRVCRGSVLARRSDLPETHGRTRLARPSNRRTMHIDAQKNH